MSMFNPTHGTPGAQPSVMQHDFSRVPRAEIPRSTFNRSHGHKTTFDAGDLVPIFVDEVIPGDTFNVQMSAFARLATPLHPFMDNVHLDSFFFFVPYRLVWDNFQRFMGEQDNPEDSTDFLVPTINNNVAYTEDSLAAHLGLPIIGAGAEGVSALPFRAYNLIYNEWFRDQNLQNSVPVQKDDGPDDMSDNYYGGSGAGLFRRGKRHDYFTSCLPWPQKGDAVSIPLGESAPVTYEDLGSVTGQTPAFGVELPNSPGYAHFHTDIDTRADPAYPDNPLRATEDGTVNWPNYYTRFLLTTDLSEAAAVTINQLRESFQIQKLLERDARGGTRYTEIIRAHFGVTSPDARLQRPEYLGGGHTMINVNPIPQTSEGTTSSPQGNLAAMGTAGIRGHGFNKSFTEHGVVIGMVCARADLTYQQGVNRMWLRQNKYDFYWPALSHIGEQAVTNREIYDNTETNDDVFGYQERWAEYRYKPSWISGKFMSDSPVSLDVWHLSQDFEELPVLGPDFIEEDPPIDRVIAVTDEPHFIFDAYFKFMCARPMPTYSVPGLIDHF
jgi:hypothetical protein